MSFSKNTKTKRKKLSKEELEALKKSGEIEVITKAVK